MCVQMTGRTMTDEQIKIELARRVMGRKIAPKEGREEFFDDDGNYPCFDPPCTVYSEFTRYKYWNPFSSWDDAMELAARWEQSGSGNTVRIVMAGYTLCEVDDYQSVNVRVIDKSGPRAVSMAVARAAGIEVEG